LEEERYIGKTLASLVKFIPEIEIIVVDEGRQEERISKNWRRQ
jgi:glycosyltransferase involved in cell wall biosynthesis